MLLEQKEKQKTAEQAKKAAAERADREKSERESVMKGKAISASRAMIEKEERPLDDDGDIFGESDIVTLPSTSSSSRTFQEPPQVIKREPVIEKPIVKVEPQVVEVVEEPEVVPEVRQKQEVKMGFTEKKFAHLPARES